MSSIERTPEYEKFIADLRAFHDRKGTMLQVEPVLGGKKLDLLRIFKTVMAAGGYEQVTINRGWKQVGDPFNFPATCTNSAYILKAVYTKYLLGWEEEMHWKRPWNPPAELLANQPKTASPVPIQPHRDMPSRQTGTAFIQPISRPQQNFPPITQHQQQQQQTYPQVPIFRDQEFKTRILLSLQSSLPNEIDWAFNTLIKFSYAAENFSLDFIPTLIDLLLDFTKEFFQQYVECTSITTNTSANKNSNSNNNSNNDGSNIDDSTIEIFCSRSQQETYERVLQVFHILRNFSFLEMNIRRLAMHERLVSLLMKGVNLPPNSQYGELSRHCLDLLENIAPQVILSGRNDPYLKTMFRLLFSNDRAFILGAIRALTRVAVTETNERVLSFADADVNRRMAQFLMIDDEGLAAATLEYLYQYSSLRGNFSTQLLKCFPGNLIGLLTGFLSYKSSLAPAAPTPIGTIHGIPAAQNIRVPEPAEPQQPPSIPDLTNYANLDEPYRCLGWLKNQLLGGTDQDTIAFKELFQGYQRLFGAEKPLGLKEFYTVLKIAFPQPPHVEQTFNSPQPLNTVLHNVKYSPTRKREGPECHWNDCTASFETTAELHKHIIHEHIEQQDRCHWMKCTKQFESKSKTHVIQHLRTHFAGKVNKHPPTKKKFIVPKTPIDDSEVSGIPLTSALLLRNLARYKHHHVYYLPYESELTLIAMQRPKISKYILTVLGELQVANN